jgi:hypothetical protein
MAFCCAPFDTAMIAVQADVRSVICAWNASLDFAERNRTHRCPLEVVEKGPGMKGTNLTSIGDRASQRMGCAIENNDTFFVLPLEMIVEYASSEMPNWQRKLFGALPRNMSYAPDYFFIPCTQIVGFNWMLKV